MYGCAAGAVQKICRPPEATHPANINVWKSRGGLKGFEPFGGATCGAAHPKTQRVRGLLEATHPANIDVWKDWSG
jgi:hypothetical protein